MKFGYYLMIKEAKELGIRYLCKCADYKDPITYKGSGVYWRRILQKHNPVITTTIIGHFITNAALRKAGIKYSKLYNIIDDPTWANLIEEIGDGGSTVHNRVRAYNVNNIQEQKFFDKVEDIPAGWLRGVPYRKRSLESIQKTANFHKGRKRSEETRKKMRSSVRKKRMVVCCSKCGLFFTPQNIKRHKCRKTI